MFFGRLDEEPRSEGLDLFFFLLLRGNRELFESSFTEALCLEGRIFFEGDMDDPAFLSIVRPNRDGLSICFDSFSQTTSHSSQRIAPSVSIMVNIDKNPYWVLRLLVDPSIHQ